MVAPLHTFRAAKPVQFINSVALIRMRFSQYSDNQLFMADTG